MITAKAILLSVGVLTILSNLPLFCYLDLKYRRISIDYFYALIGINAPVAAVIYLSGWISLFHLLVSLAIAAVIWGGYLVYRSGAYSGADRNLLICIILFTFYNPLSPLADPTYADFIAWVYQVKFLTYFAMVMCFVPLVILIRNIVRYEKHDVLGMVTAFPGGFPMVLPITAAYLITMVWGL